jgi:4-alpha-glucanotransferase
MRYQRHSGLLLHPTSLPGPEGIGTFGAAGRQFVDFLAAAGQTLWQILPLGPTGYGNSPYSCYSAFAGNPLLIDLNAIAAEGDLAHHLLPTDQSSGRIDYDAVVAWKMPLLQRAAATFLAAAPNERKQEFWRFCDTTFWLHDYALFMACRDHFKGKGWHTWPPDLAGRKATALESYSRQLGIQIGTQKYLQWQFHRQWQALKRYANERGIRIVGDAPIFVAHDSADVWCNQHLFQLDGKGKPLAVAGVPPDYFSKTGQRWGNPLYNWQRMAEDGYGWWVARLRNDLGLYDMVRIDHFRGFEAYWEIPASHKTAIKGRWIKGPGAQLFQSLCQTLGELPIIAEDLGVITPEVEQLRDSFTLPGMKILQFAFEGGSGNGYLPHNHVPNCVVYTGTHDNDTTRGWFSQLSPDQKRNVLHYLRCDEPTVVEEMVRLALASVARMAIVPVQDILQLDGSARMNIPGIAGGNWGWRLAANGLTDDTARVLGQLTGMYGRG